MRRTGYQLLGFAVWRIATWYLRRQLAVVVKPAKYVAGAGVGLGLLALVAYVLTRRGNGDENAGNGAL
jgi:hypothetical protein